MASSAYLQLLTTRRYIKDIQKVLAHKCFLTAIIGLAILFYSKTGFWPSYCQISTDRDKILHTPIVVGNTLVGRLRSRSARGRLQAKSERLCFCNTCNERTVSHRDDRSPRFRRQTVKVEVRTGAIVINSGIL